MDQYLIDYTVRNITTGDEEEVRILEMTDEEAAELPADARAVLEPLRRDYQRDNVIPHPDWDHAQDELLRLLLPRITDRPLYERDYATWEARVLGDDSLSPEDTTLAVRHVLHAAVEAAIENWNEGFWEEFGDSTPVRDVLAQFAGYLTAWLESVDDETDPELAKSLLTISYEEAAHAAR